MPHGVRARVASGSVPKRVRPRNRDRDQDLGSAVAVEGSSVGSQHLAPSAKEFAEAAVATLLVAGVPVAIVWWLRASGAVSSGAVGVLLGMGLSLAVSWVACLVWERRTGSEDLLFSELMIWGFLHRWRTQRRLASARELLGPMSEAQRSAANGLGTEDPVKLLERLVARMETRDPYLHGHSRRVARHSWMIAKRMGLPRAQVARIRTAAAIHDVGKINTPRTILHKTGPLTAEEFDVIKRHPGDGARMAAVLRDAELIAMVRDHHERLDGSGYPSALLGDEIAVGARIIAVADTDHLGAPVPVGAYTQAGDRDPEAGGRHQARPGRRACVLQPLRWSSSPRPMVRGRGYSRANALMARRELGWCRVAGEGGCRCCSRRRRRSHLVDARAACSQAEAGEGAPSPRSLRSGIPCPLDVDATPVARPVSDTENATT
jgi:HD domain